jgi:two-component system response regulator ResD
MRVLVVEDREIDRLILRTELEPHFEVTFGRNAQEALQLALNNHFDVALINVMLQEDMEAALLLPKLQQLSEFPMIAIALTSHLDEQRIRTLMAVGFQHILYKPFDTRVFEQVLFRLAPATLMRAS